ncbi:MAG: hypothetical protein QMD77_00615 [Patescibacteria group bacterium]|nr:hypothetical protein [Patescibacteria group bacterium]
MDVGKCTLQGKIRTLDEVIGGRRKVIHVPKGSDCSAQDVLSLMESLGLDGIKMVGPGIITPWRFGCKVAHFKGDVLQAMETLPADARHFYHKALFPSSR